MDTPTQNLLTEKQAADFLNVARGTLTNWRSAGRGPVYTRIGSRIRYRLEDLVSFVENRMVQPSEEAA